MNPERNWYGNIIAWFANNSVAANLLMLCLLFGGLVTAFTITKEIQPRIETNYVTVTVPYRGGTPRDVEQGVLIKIEETIQDIEGIKEMVATGREGSGSVQVEVNQDYDVLEVLDEIKTRVDSISTFPAETERPVYQRNTWTQEVIWVSVFGDVGERTLKEAARDIRDEIIALPDVTRAELVGTRAYEIGIEVREETLRSYDLTLGEVAQAIRESSLDLPGGRIETAGGDVLVRTIGQAYVGRDFEDIVVRSNPDGSRVLVRDIATIRDGFVERERYARHNGQPATAIRILSVGEQNALAVSEAVRDYIAEKQEELPDGLSVDWWADISYYLKGRMEMMGKNLIAGAVLVFLILALFLRLKLAFWVMVGLLIAFLGALWMLPAVGVTINLISLFGFLVVLGIVVDDAIVMGESAYTEIREKGHSVDNVVNGVYKVAIPATFGVLTTIAAFLPILMISGISGQFFAAIGWVVVLCLFMSLVESKLILPAHLAHMRIKKHDPDTTNRFIRFQRSFSDGMFRFVDRFYLPSLGVLMRNRYLSLAAFISILILSLGLVFGGIVPRVFFPDFTGDFMQAELEMNEGTPAYVTHANMDRLARKLEAADEKLQEKHGLEDDIVRTVFAWSGSDTSGGMLVELARNEDSPVTITELERAWREAVGQIPGARGLRIGNAGGGPGGGGPDISFQLVGNDLDQLESAAADLESRVNGYEGTYDVRNSFEGGLKELQLEIKPEAEVLGLSQQNLARQVRQAFFGEEVQRIQRGQDDVRVMVRYPREQRTSEGYLEAMRIRTPDGSEVPFGSVADVKVGNSPSVIRRFDRQRSISVTARVDKEIAEPGRITEELRQTHLPEILAGYPSVSYRVSGATRSQQEVARDLLIGTAFALFLIYALIAVPLRSYLQPLLIMSVIPFGMVGAVAGHWLLGIPISMLSFFGIIALAGVVVNDSLILVDFVNRHRRAGESRIDAAVKAARSRFRPIILTSATTFLGLAPIVFFETSLQAQIVIPMATSLAFGIVFATVITLGLIPILYLIGDDFVHLLQRILGRERTGMVASQEA
ncbi:MULTISPECIES: efflux RND transporter permease subunit [unclassified Wenzhouxiangella]|uniref:efflux RND transporter permease subunit n=1 Tax=unclassified Wenzhouxiangella TaxID=2613841 RepID=UPI000E32C9F9|nr:MULTISPECIES: efflux RND transporter permease subunit [unclassified Wenzhouxiangella]RFF28104.1 efflux RND transporter permease subunit [Wenzhouxiangella sp. 15181]RFP68100.1 efflux RND transporter permease subunit [Wenzhouxiangella sp. 15190]